MSKSKKIEPVIANDLEVQEKNDQEVFDSFMETIGKAAGSKSKQFGEMVFNQLANSCH